MSCVASPHGYGASRRPKLGIADIFRANGSAWRKANIGHVSLAQLKVMSAIETCRTKALGGHVALCGKCRHIHIYYNSCRNRHCPTCLGGAAIKWLQAREAELLPVPYFHLVFTLPAPIREIAFQNKRVLYDLLLRISAKATLKIAATQKHPGAKIGMTSVLHTWGSAMMHHPHVHMIVPGGGFSDDGGWVSCKPNFFVHVKPLSRLFKRLFCEQLLVLHRQGKLVFFGDLEDLAERRAFAKWLAPLRKIDWVVYAKKPFAGPKMVLAYLSRYTHRVAISNSRLVKFEKGRVSFKYKDYRAQKEGEKGCLRKKTMTLDADEFIRRFLLHVLPRGFHRIRYYGWMANGGRAKNLASARELLGVLEEKPCDEETTATEPGTAPCPCPCCGGSMEIIAVFEPGRPPRAPPGGAAWRAYS